eukprot:TRINITY_DN25541_c0_g1_i1.p1 TRINITY_DN25541_c0_g1~~TRINITY_DN25541_c0_g1_i1.p1  ORF type:complete len:574 (+),score=160.89 TRINITY_DN25541_c0_g1_i1:38-1723(+)
MPDEGAEEVPLEIGDEVDEELEDFDGEVSDDEHDDESLETALKNVKLQKVKDAPPEVRPTITKQPEVIDDFIRNFLVNSGLTNTLSTFELEWYEYKAKAEAEGKPDLTFLVPDTYLSNASLHEQVTQLTEEVAQHRSAYEEMKTKFENVRNQRDFHKLSHNRVVQEKNKLQKDLKRLQAHNQLMEPMLVELRVKNESVMKERMLIRLERDKLQTKVKNLEEMVAKLEGMQKGVVQTPTAEKKKKAAAGAVWPTEDKVLSARSHAPPTNLTSMTCRTTFKGHSMTVTSVAVHPKKSFVATSSDDKTWKLWSIPGGELVMSGDEHKDWVSGIAFHPRSTHLATSSGDGTVKVWDFAKAGSVHTFGDHTQEVWDVAWHYGGDFLASCSVDHTTRIWDVTVGKARQTLRGHVDSVNSVMFQPGTNLLATASGDKTVSLWDPRTGFCVHTFYGHANAVNQAAFSTKGEMLSSVDADGMVIVWDMRTIGEVAKESCGPHPANTSVFDKSDTNVLIGSDDSTIYVYNIADRKISTLRGHEDAVQALAFSHDNTYFVSASSDATARYWM